MPWKPGNSGNPGGRPKGVRKLLKLATKHAPKALAYALRLLEEPDIGEEPKDMVAHRRVKLEAAKLIASYGMGAPPRYGEGVDAMARVQLPRGLSIEVIEAVASQPLSTELPAPTDAPRLADDTEH
jgi:hypothetical protein